MSYDKLNARILRWSLATCVKVVPLYVYPLFSILSPDSPPVRGPGSPARPHPTKIIKAPINS